MVRMDDQPPLDQLVNELNSSDLEGRPSAHRFEEWITVLRGKGGSDLYLIAGVPRRSEFRELFVRYRKLRWQDRKSKRASFRCFPHTRQSGIGRPDVRMRHCGSR